jgi:hypothetical protein
MTCAVRNNLHRVRFRALLPRLETEQDAVMKKRLSAHSRKMSTICGLLLFLEAPRLLMGEPTPAAVFAFNSYSKTAESRLAQQHRSPNSFLAPAASDPEGAETRLRQGALILERLTPSTGANLSGALLHHWRGTAFAAGAKAGDFERLMRDFNSYPQHFSPQVLQAKVFTQGGDRMQAWMRVRQRHVITVVMDTTYDITFGHLDVQHGYSISESARIAEIDAAGTGAERTLSASEEHGYLWRLNTYWSYMERDGGLYLQIEAVSLTRSIPRGFGWAIQPYVESIPRESLEFTLRSACNALRK